MRDVVVRELPLTHPLRVFISKEEGWETQQVEFLEKTREIWETDRGLVWSEFWHVAERWVSLTDKFFRTGDEKVSSELRQLEKDLRALEAAAEAKALADEAAEAAAAKAAGGAEEPVDDEVAQMRARIAAAAG